MRVATHISTLCFAIFVAWLGVGCTTDEAIIERINKAESIAEERPAEALAIMQRIDHDDICGDKDNARYALVYSEVLYHNDIKVDNDSLTLPMMMYYLDSDNHDERVRALYQHALVKAAAHNHGEAMFSLISAEESFEHIDNNRIKGLIHRTMGEIYNAECMFGSALDSHIKAKEYFDKANLPQHSAYALYDIAVTHASKRAFNDAERYAMQAYDVATSQENDHLLAHTSCLLCRICVQQEEYAACREYLPVLTAHAPAFTFYYNCYKAICDAHDGNFAAADTSLGIARDCSDNAEKTATIVEPVILDYATSLVLYYKDDLKASYSQYQSCIENQDERLMDALNRPVLNNQIELFEQKLTAARKELRYKRVQQISILIVGTVIIALLLAYLYCRRVAYKRKVDFYRTTINELQLIAQNSNVPTVVVETVNVLYRDALIDLNKIFEVYYQHNDTSRHSKKVMEQVEQNIATLQNDNEKFAELERVVNQTNHNIISQLREAETNLTERDFRIIVYSLAGFTTNTICLLMDITPDNIHNIRNRIRQRVRNSEVGNNSQIIDKLYSNKH